MGFWGRRTSLHLALTALPLAALAASWAVTLTDVVAEETSAESLSLELRVATVVLLLLGWAALGLLPWLAAALLWPQRPIIRGLPVAVMGSSLAGRWLPALWGGNDLAALSLSLVIALAAAAAVLGVAIPLLK